MVQTPLSTNKQFYPMKKSIFIVVALVVGLLLGGWLTFRYTTNLFEQRTEERATVLLQEIKKVAKLVSVEGYFSEIYNYKNIAGYDISMFRKKALLRIQAKVSIGYDLGNLEIVTDEATKTVFIGKLPQPEIISIDHEVDYYDIQEGTFNYFTPEDYTKLNQRAKEIIRKKAEASALTQAAVEQGQDILQLIELMVESVGWRVEYDSSELGPVNVEEPAVDGYRLDR